jgi:hypothetical protein
MHRYTISDFYTIYENIKNNNMQLPENTIDIINNLALKVGSPEYIKTPLFKNKTFTNISNRRRKKSSDYNNSDDWDTLRFKTTEVISKTNKENSLHKIRKYLNMLTYNTYEKLKNNIINELQTTDQTSDIFNNLAKEIFKIMISNILYSEIYAKLYKDLINNFNIFEEILLENLDNFDIIFKDIEYIDPEKDYNKFCQNNKNNENRRANCIFYINLMKENIIDYNKIGSVILSLFDYLYSIISEKTKKNVIDELAELSYIMIINSYEYLNKLDTKLSNTIYNNVLKITKIKCKEETGITNKCIFKHMDILDEIKDDINDNINE